VGWQPALAGCLASGVFMLVSISLFVCGCIHIGVIQNIKHGGFSGCELAGHAVIAVSPAVTIFPLSLVLVFAVGISKLLPFSVNRLSSGDKQTLQNPSRFATFILHYFQLFSFSYILQGIAVAFC
jgi:hypothetical protein